MNNIIIDLTFQSSGQMKWEEAATYADMLFKRSKWSKVTSYTLTQISIYQLFLYQCFFLCIFSPCIKTTLLLTDTCFTNTHVWWNVLVSRTPLFPSGYVPVHCCLLSDHAQAWRTSTSRHRGNQQNHEVSTNLKARLLWRYILLCWTLCLADAA